MEFLFITVSPPSSIPTLLPVFKSPLILPGSPGGGRKGESWRTSSWDALTRTRCGKLEMMTRSALQRGWGTSARGGGTPGRRRRRRRRGCAKSRASQCHWSRVRENFQGKLRHRSAWEGSNIQTGAGWNRIRTPQKLLVPRGPSPNGPLAHAGAAVG